MNEALNRDEIVGLLQSLGSDRDEEVLAAARELHTLITDADAAWEDLLVADETDDDTSIDQPEPTEPTAETAADNAETLRLIDKLLAKPGISDDFRDELNGYKTDIAEGEFEETDHRYVRALYNRLMPPSR